MSVLAKLREATAAEHRAIEAAVPLLDDDLDAVAYAAHRDRRRR